MTLKENYEGDLKESHCTKIIMMLNKSTTKNENNAK